MTRAATQQADEMSHGTEVWSVTFLGQDALASRGKDNKVRVWDLVTRRQRGAALAVHKFASYVEGSPGGTRGLAVGVDVIVFDPTTAKATRRIKYVAVAIDSAAFAGNDRVIAATGKDHRSLFSFDLEREGATTVVDLGGRIDSVAATPDGRRVFAIVVTIRDGKIVDRQLLELDAQLEERSRIALPAPAGEWVPRVVATAGGVFVEDGTLSVVEGGIRRVLDERSLALSPDGARAVVDRDGAPWLVSVGTGKGEKLAPQAQDAAFSPDGRQVVLASGPTMTVIGV